MPNCAVLKPITTPRPLSNFGFPKGTTGRTGGVMGILIHCIPDFSYYARSGGGALNRPRGDLHSSVHYSVPIKGQIIEHISPSNVAWGLGPTLAAGSSTPEYGNCAELTWGLAEIEAPPDDYLIHIAIESSSIKALSDNCDCPPMPSQQLQNLSHLIAYLAQEYEITIDAQHINFLHLIEPCKQNECGCDPDIQTLLSRVNSFEQAYRNASDPTFKATSNDPIYIYGENECGVKEKTDITALLDVISGAQNVIANVTATMGGTTTLNFASGRTQRVTLGSGTTTFAFSNIPTGVDVTVIIIQPAGGDGLVTWPASAKWADAFAPVLTSIANARDLFRFVASGSRLDIIAATFNL